jgi:hypothetical protein
VVEGNAYIKDILQKEGLKVFVLGNEVVDAKFSLSKKNELKKTLYFVIDIMDMGYTQGFISEMNFTVFKDGVSKFFTYLDGVTVEETAVSKLLKGLIDMQSEIDRKNAKELALKDVVNKNLPNVVPEFKSEKKEVNFNKDELQVAQEEEADIVIKKEENEDAKEEKNDPKDRKQKIIELLKDKGGQNIKDIKEEVRHVTDKTILRDITELMLEKKVFRVGEKRWAKYYLK